MTKNSMSELVIYAILALFCLGSVFLSFYFIGKAGILISCSVLYISLFIMWKLNLIESKTQFDVGCILIGFSLSIFISIYEVAVGGIFATLTVFYIIFTVNSRIRKILIGR